MARPRRCAGPRRLRSRAPTRGRRDSVRAASPMVSAPPSLAILFARRGPIDRIRKRRAFTPRRPAVGANFRGAAGKPRGREPPVHWVVGNGSPLQASLAGARLAAACGMATAQVLERQAVPQDTEVPAVVFD